MLRTYSYKVGRKLYCWARRESANSPEANGEYALLSQFLARAIGPVTLLDVGANRGEWSRKAVSLAYSNRTSLTVHAFEPQSGTRTILEDSVSDLHEVQVEPLGLSNTAGTAAFYSHAAGAGTSSLHPLSGAQTEIVTLTTLDDWIEDHQYDQVGMIKIDVEGFDSLVLEGALRTLSEGRVELIQFEYNWRWLLNSRSLHWIFQFIKDKPYTVGKVVPHGVLTFDRWHFELDRFFEGNYVLLRQGSAAAECAKPARFDESNVLCLG